MGIHVEHREGVTVAWSIGPKHRFYEDRYRMLTPDIPRVAAARRGALVAVCDGIGGAPRGMDAAQEVCDHLTRFYLEPDRYPATWEGLRGLLLEANSAIHGWGLIPGTDRPLGGCAATAIWVYDDTFFVFHAGDTVALLLRDGEVIQLTHVHENDLGLFKYFGIGSVLALDVRTESLEPCDRVLLISDGVTKVMHPRHAAEIALERTPESAVREVTERARGKGSPDDVTVMVVELDELTLQMAF